MATPKKSAAKTATRKTAPSKKKAAPPKIVKTVTVPERKFDWITGYVDSDFPEIAQEDERYAVLLMVLEESMPGINFKMSYIKHQEGLEGRIREGLLSWNPAQLEGASDADYHEYYEFLSRSLANAMKGMVPEASTVSVPRQVAPVPVSQWSDKVLLDTFLDEPREEGIVGELEKRSRGLPFLAYPGGSTKPGDCVRDLSLDLLKNARRNLQIPRRMEGCVVYSMAQIDLKNRVRHECPLCIGVPLIRGVCPSCNTDFTNVGKEDRIWVRIGTLALSNPGGGVASSVTNAVLNEFICLCRSNPFGAAKEASKNIRVRDMKETLALEGRLPTLILVDDPMVLGSEQSLVLRAVDAFHRNGRS